MGTARDTASASFAGELLGEYRTPFMLASVSLFCVTVAISVLIKSARSVEPIRFSGEGSRESSSSGSLLTVDVAGAVANPGIYRLSADARVGDAITAAGGLTSRADNEVVEKALNRAARLSDGAKIYIPPAGEGESDKTSHNNSFATSTQDSSQNSGLLLRQGLSQNEPSSLVSINNASQSELELLNGIGPVTAKKIIGNRPYTELVQLKDRKVLSASLYEKLVSQLSL